MIFSKNFFGTPCCLAIAVNEQHFPEGLGPTDKSALVIHSRRAEASASDPMTLPSYSLPSLFAAPAATSQISKLWPRWSGHLKQRRCEARLLGLLAAPFAILFGASGEQITKNQNQLPEMGWSHLQSLPPRCLAPYGSYLRSSLRYTL